MLFEHHKEHFARDTQHMWWSYVTLMKIVKEKLDGTLKISNGFHIILRLIFSNYNAIRREYGRL